MITLLNLWKKLYKRKKIIFKNTELQLSSAGFLSELKFVRPIQKNYNFYHKNSQLCAGQSCQLKFHHVPTGRSNCPYTSHKSPYFFSWLIGWLSEFNFRLELHSWLLSKQENKMALTYSKSWLNHQIKNYLIPTLCWLFFSNIKN